MPVYFNFVLQSRIYIEFLCLYYAYIVPFNQQKSMVYKPDFLLKTIESSFIS